MVLNNNLKWFFAEKQLIDQTLIKKAWEDFMVNGKLDSRISSEIAESWMHCKNNNVNPLMHAFEVTSNPFNEERLEQNQFLINSADGIIQKLRIYIDNSSSLIQLINSEGILLEKYGSSLFNQKAEGINNVPGLRAEEQWSGTNATGLALKFQKPSFVVGAEHFCSLLHDWTCYAVPIFNRKANQMMGVLDISGPEKVFSPHSFGLVQAGVEAIEKVIIEEELKKESYLLDYYIQQISNSTTPVMVVNKYGFIIRCSERAFDLLGTPNLWQGRHLRTLNIPSLVEHMALDETELEISALLKNEINVRFVVQKAWHNNEFIGWIIRLFPMRLQKTVPVPSSKVGHSSRSLIGSSPIFLEVLEKANKVALSQADVLIIGETGTGKEVFARSIHLASARSNGPFIAVNCGAIPKELIGSELFGYEEGAFSGAKKGGVRGKFELAKGGTLFLDEIGELPLEQQVYLLRVLQERVVQRIGGTKEIPVDVRIIAATNVDIVNAVANKSFREDLYFRLNVIRIDLPSLRERGKADIISLAKLFVSKFNRREGKNTILSEPLLNVLFEYDWPGNVRELENLMYRLVVLSGDGLLSLENVPEELREKRQSAFLSPVTDPILKNGVKDILREEIIKAIRRNNGNYSKAAKQLGISRTTLYRKIGEYKKESQI
jgi:sigma-54 dependent transcriptional regulator, acetoin dehydrogenase operon transcriptional activator AcoR